MSENNLTSPRDPELRNRRTSNDLVRNILRTAGHAIIPSFVIFFMAYAFGSRVNGLDFLWAFSISLSYAGAIVPFTLVAILLYRITKLPSRFELLTVILVIGIGFFFVILFPFL